jgi:tRNA(Ile)-lysidine synthase
MATRAVAVAYSGGRDSSALLHACLQAARALGADLQVHALHVHHGLSEHADAWLAHCQSVCADWAQAGLPVQFHGERLQTQPQPGQSIEAWAREHRYIALARMARGVGADLILLAHHRRDQAETWLLQALRGAGSAGLAAMPKQHSRENLCWARPWLEQPREFIETYVREHAIAHIEDDSNLDSRFARNRLRLQVMPVLQQAFVGAEQQLAMAATWAQQSRELEVEIAAEDLARLSSEAGLDVPALLALSPARVSNALRAWLHAQADQAAPASLVLRLLDELPRMGTGRWPWAGSELRLYRARLRFEATPGVQSLLALPAEQTVDLHRPGSYTWPQWGGELTVTLVDRGGMALDRLRQATLRQRRGGETFQQTAHGMPRSLKKVFQNAAIAAWDRDGPLIFSADGALLFVPGLGMDARQIEREPGSQALLSWRRFPGHPGLPLRAG